MTATRLKQICSVGETRRTAAIPGGPRTAAAAILALCAIGMRIPAAEPLVWERTPNRPAPAQFDTFHGETLDFRCTFTGWEGRAPSRPFADGADVRLWYQTNGMGAAWWSIPATISSNMLAASFPPSADPGAERLTVFFGSPSNAYAAAQVRFRNSPGAMPNNLDPPSVLDWQAELSAATNALWESSAAAFMPQSNAYTKAETDARIIELSPPGMTTNDVCAIVTNVVGGEWSAWTVYRDGVDVTDRVAQPWYVPPPDDHDPEEEWLAWRTPVVAEDQEFSTADGEHGDENTDSLSWSGVDNQHVEHEYTATRRRLPVRNALGLARLEDLPSTNGFVRVDDVSSIVTNETADFVKQLEPIYIWQGKNVPYNIFGPTNETSFKGPNRIKLKLRNDDEVCLSGGSSYIISTANETFDGHSKTFTFDISSTDMRFYPELITNRIEMYFMQFVGQANYRPTFGNKGYMSELYDDVGFAPITDLETAISRISAIEAQLVGLENALHAINTGTNLVTNGGN